MNAGFTTENFSMSVSASDTRNTGDFVADDEHEIENGRRARRRNRYVPSKDELRYGFRAYLISQACRIVALCIRCSVPIGIVWVVGQAWIARTALLAGKTTSAKIDERFSLWTNLLEPLVDELGPIEWVAGIGLAVAIAAIALARRSRRRYQDNIEKLARFRERYERAYDKRRSSSRLTSRGDPPPEQDL